MSGCVKKTKRGRDATTDVVAEEEIYASDVLMFQEPLVEGQTIEETVEKMVVERVPTRRSKRIKALEIALETEKEQAKLKKDVANGLAQLWVENLKNANIDWVKYEGIFRINSSSQSDQYTITFIVNSEIVTLMDIQTITLNDNPLSKSVIQDPIQAYALASNINTVIKSLTLKSNTMYTINNGKLQQQENELKLANVTKIPVYVPLKVVESIVDKDTVDTLGFVQSEEERLHRYITSKPGIAKILDDWSMKADYSELLEWVSSDRYVINPDVLEKALHEETKNGKEMLEDIDYEDYLFLIRIIKNYNEFERTSFEMIAKLNDFHIYECPQKVARHEGGSSWTYITKKASSFLSSVKQSISSKAREATKPTKKKSAKVAASSIKKQDKLKPKKQEVEPKQKAKKAKAPEPRKKVADKPKKAAASATKKPTKSSKKL
jgi:hypothetical protein